MEVDQPAGLVLPDLGVLQRGEFAEVALGDAEGLGEGAADRDGGAPPQFGCPPLPHDRRGPVVAVPTQRGAVEGVVLAMDLHAAGRAAVAATLRAVARCAPSAGALPVGRAGSVDGAEGGGGEGDEQQRVVRHVGGDGLAALDAGADHLEGVAGIDPRAVAAHLGPPVATRPIHHTKRRLPGGEDIEDLTGDRIDGGGASDQADRVGAVADLRRRIGPVIEGAVTQPPDQAVFGRRGEAGQVQRRILTEAREPRDGHRSWGCVTGHAREAHAASLPDSSSTRRPAALRCMLRPAHHPALMPTSTA